MGFVAAALARLLGSPPLAWATETFRARVDAIRVQLGPIRCLDAVGSTRSRDSHGQPGSTCSDKPPEERLATCPVALAYAIRSSELANDRDGTGESVPLMGWTQRRSLPASQRS